MFKISHVNSGVTHHLGSFPSLQTLNAEDKAVFIADGVFWSVNTIHDFHIRR